MSYTVQKPTKPKRHKSRTGYHCEERLEVPKRPKDRFAEDIRNTIKSEKRDKMLRSPRRG